ncbi:hypothetical protein SAMN02745723_10598 [Pragia fontium DSM 5563 = ATCC 49100]|uniref:Uncharacterized protein n=1 Tax=Pragia fontium DSM 5563 = ATCC 49100 TaxID=1122977 RepID=A0AAJ5BHB2_9GAMM|nr:hypothetical protein SAMN02745723_10598 [Pragia fontium DSM 5563 = ATCC 49100]
MVFFPPCQATLGQDLGHNCDLSGIYPFSFLDSLTMRGYNAASNFPDFIRDASDKRDRVP